MHANRVPEWQCLVGQHLKGHRSLFACHTLSNPRFIMHKPEDKVNVVFRFMHTQGLESDRSSGCPDSWLLALKRTLLHRAMNTANGCEGASLSCSSSPLLRCCATFYSNGWFHRSRCATSRNGFRFLRPLPSVVTG